jgi:hypothetical protein
VTDDRDDAPARLDRRVAEAADAWLTDPRDTGVYARLVAAVTERRAALDAPPRPVEPEAEVAVVPDPAPDADPDADLDQAVEVVDDDDSEPVVPLRPVGADLLGDPRAVLDRLRRG